MANSSTLDATTTKSRSMAYVSSCWKSMRPSSPCQSTCVMPIRSRCRVRTQMSRRESLHLPCAPHHQTWTKSARMITARHWPDASRRLRFFEQMTMPLRWRVRCAQGHRLCCPHTWCRSTLSFYPFFRARRVLRLIGALFVPPMKRWTWLHGKPESVMNRALGTMPMHSIS